MSFRRSCLKMRRDARTISVRASERVPPPIRTDSSFSDSLRRGRIFAIG